ncbi:MAG: enoyl-CoA hydratase/isomerase family protein [Burkholderiaceae bacterium]
MANTPVVSIQEHGRVATVTLDRGYRANPLSMQALEELKEAAEHFHDRPDISAVVLTGRADGFCMGMDLKDPVLGRLRGEGLAKRRLSLRAGPSLCEAWEKVDAITICAIEGWCAGGGAALAVACDLRVMAESARLYVPEVERGMNMTWGSIPRLTALIGPARTKRLAALCEQVDAPLALNWGLADEIVSDGQALANALRIASRAAALPPTAMKMVKHDVNVAAHALSRATGHRDLEAFALMERSEDFREGVESFLAGRGPRYTGN